MIKPERTGKKFCGDLRTKGQGPPRRREGPLQAEGTAFGDGSTHDQSGTTQDPTPAVLSKWGNCHMPVIIGLGSRRARFQAQIKFPIFLFLTHCPIGLHTLPLTIKIVLGDEQDKHDCYALNKP